jgi:hypothetical protein
LAILAFGIPVLAPVALIAGLVAGICKDNEEYRRTRRHDDHDVSDSNEDEHDAYRRISAEVDSDINSMLRRFHEQRRQPEYQRRMASQNFNFTPFRAENEDNDMPRFINHNHEERRPRGQADNTNEPSLRNEEYFRRHNR